VPRHKPQNPNTDKDVRSVNSGKTESMISQDLKKVYGELEPWQEPLKSKKKVRSVGDILAIHKKAEKAKTEAQRKKILALLEDEEK